MVNHTNRQKKEDSKHMNEVRGCPTGQADCGAGGDMESYQY